MDKKNEALSTANTGGFFLFDYSRQETRLSETILQKCGLTQSSMLPTLRFWVAAVWTAAFIVRPDRNCLQNAVRCMAAKPAVQKLQRGTVCPANMSSMQSVRVGGDGKHQEQELLESCYRTSLNLAKENGCQSMAFPLISSGIYGYPKDQALKVAVDIISTFLLENEMMVYIVIFDKKVYQISGKLFADIAAYIDDRYVEEHTDRRVEQRRRLEALSEESCFAPASLPPEAICKSCSSQSLEEALGQIDESFSEMLLRKIDESGMTDAQCYKKANIDRKLFSKIRSDKFYKPSKPTVLAFAMALELPLAQMREMLGKAGFTFPIQANSISL